MTLYNSPLVEIILSRKRSKRERYFTVFGRCFTRYKYLEIWEDMELRTHERRHSKCFLLALMPSLVLSLSFSWWFTLLALFSYHLLYWAERWLGYYSSSDWEALEHCGDILYLRKRKFCTWMKWYGRRTLPPSEWED